MAKAGDVELDPGEPFALAGARAVEVRTEELFGHADGVLDTADVDRVHDMRVASRRLRAALEIFAPAFPSAPFKSALSDVKALADALGERRDPDVQLAALKELAAAMPGVQEPGAEALAERLRGRQVLANAALAGALEHVERSGLRERLLALAGQARDA